MTHGIAGLRIEIVSALIFAAAAALVAFRSRASGLWAAAWIILTAGTGFQFGGAFIPVSESQRLSANAYEPARFADLEFAGYQGWNYLEGVRYTIGGAERIAVDHRVPQRATVRLSGWIANQVTGKPALAAYVIFDDRVPFFGRYGTARPDVATALSDADARNVGFEFVIPPRALPPGHHRFRLALVDDNGRDDYQSVHEYSLDVLAGR